MQEPETSYIIYIYISYIIYTCIWLAFEGLNCLHLLDMWQLSAVFQITASPSARSRQLWRRTGNFFKTFLQFYVYDLRFKAAGLTTFLVEFWTLLSDCTAVQIPVKFQNNRKTVWTKSHGFWEFIMRHFILMAQCKIAVTPLLLHRSHHSLVLSHPSGALLLIRINFYSSMDK